MVVERGRSWIRSAVLSIFAFIFASVLFYLQIELDYLLAYMVISICLSLLVGAMEDFTYKNSVLAFVLILTSMLSANVTLRHTPELAIKWTPFGNWPSNWLLVTPALLAVFTYFLAKRIAKILFGKRLI